MELILASTSIHRKKVLTEANIPFTAKTPLDDEEAHKKNIKHLPVENQALELARLKAKGLSLQYPNAFVLGGDQICECDNAPLNKPHTPEEVTKQLIKLSGKIIYLRTAISIMKNGAEVFSCVESPTVHYKENTEEQLKTAVKKSENLGFNHVGIAGAFPLESPCIKDVIHSVEGEMPTIIGIPLTQLKTFLKQQSTK